VKRLSIYVLLGPALGFCILMYGIVPLLSWRTGAEFSFGFDWHQLSLLPMAYFMGALPALITATADSALARRGVGARIVWVALVGFAACFLPIWSAVAMGYVHGPYVLAFGLVGAVPAFACCWLSGR
jgi:hypothetical protein